MANENLDLILLDENAVKNMMPVVVELTESETLVQLNQDGTQSAKTYTSWNEFFTLVTSGRVQLYYNAVGSDKTKRKALYQPHMVADYDPEKQTNVPAIRFDATGTLGDKVYTRSIAVTKNGDGIAVSVGILTEVAKASDIPSSLSQLSNDSGFVVSSDVYTKNQVDSALSGKLNTSGDQRISGNLTIKRYFSIEDSDNKNIYFNIGADGYIYKGYSNGKETHISIPDATGELALVSQIPTTDKIKGIFIEQLDDKISQDKITSLAEAAVEDKITSEDQNLVDLIKKYGGTQIKEDEKGFYYEVEEA